MKPTFIILAAGMGVRADAQSLNCPKVLLKAGNGRSLLVNMLDKIYKNSSDNPHIRVVVGFLREQVISEIDHYCRAHSDASVEVVYNEIYERGVITSLHRGVRGLNTNIVILNGDTFYPDILFHNLKGLRESSLLVLPPNDQPDSVRVLTGNDQVLQVGKKLVEFDYISTGCLFLDSHHASLVEDILFDLIAHDTFEGMIWHNVINLLSQRGQNIGFKVVHNSQIYEIDTKEDYQNFLKDAPELPD